MTSDPSYSTTGPPNINKALQMLPLTISSPHKHIVCFSTQPWLRPGGMSSAPAGCWGKLYLRRPLPPAHTGAAKFNMAASRCSPRSQQNCSKSAGMPLYINHISTFTGVGFVCKQGLLMKSEQSSSRYRLILNWTVPRQIYDVQWGIKRRKVWFFVVVWT